MSVNLSRRGFLAGLGASLATPALVRASSLDFVPHEHVHPGWVHPGDERWAFNNQTVVGRSVVIPRRAKHIEVIGTKILDAPGHGALYREAGHRALFAIPEGITGRIRDCVFESVPGANMRSAIHVTNGVDLRGALGVYCRDEVPRVVLEESTFVAK